MESNRLTGLSVLTLGASLFFAPCGAAGEAFSFPRATPESQGVRTEDVEAFVARLHEQEGAVHAFMLLRRGHVIAEGAWAPYDLAIPHALYSISKAFTSLAVGYAVEDRQLSLDDRIAWHFPDDLPAGASGHVRDVRVRDLMKMASGHRRDPLSAMRANGVTNWAKAYFSVPVEDPPGIFFRYMTGNTCLLAQLHRRVTGEADMLAYLRPRLFDKLGMRPGPWMRQPDGTVFGGSGFHLTAEDLAKMAQLLLQEGVWQGERVAPLAWVKQATSCQTPFGRVMDSVLALHTGDNNRLPREIDAQNDWQQGYGFQLWMGRHETFRLCGAYGQIAVIVPKKDFVCVVLAGANGSNKRSVEAFYDTLLARMDEKPLPENPDRARRLQERLRTLELPVPKPAARPAESVREACRKTYRFAPAARGIVSVACDLGNGAIVFENAYGRQTLRVGEGEWLSSEVATDAPSLQGTHVLPGGFQRVGASGAWVDAQTYRVKMCYLSSPHTMTLDFRFADGALALTFDAPLAKIDRQTFTARP